MTNDLIRPGYAASVRRKQRVTGQTVCVQLIATVALVVSLVIAVTAVSIGIARAGAFHPIVIQATRLG